MSSKSIMFKRISSESLDELSNKVAGQLIDFGAELVFNNLHKKEGTEVLLMVFEKYYFRNGSYTALTFQCISSGDTQTAIVVGTGGGEGLFNVSWGANKSFARNAQNVLEQCGFEAYTLKQ